MKSRRSYDDDGVDVWMIDDVRSRARLDCYWSCDAFDAGDPFGIRIRERDDARETVISQKSECSRMGLRDLATPDDSTSQHVPSELSSRHDGQQRLRHSPQSCTPEDTVSPMNDGVRLDTLPLTYDECRARLRRAAESIGVRYETHPIAALGPHDQRLTIETLRIGREHAGRALVVLSGVHGVEGFVNSTLQTDALLRWSSRSRPDDVAVVFIHAVNPWGMAWWRRQNESNVDLNRNWRRDAGVPFQNDAYDEVHPLACPDTDTLPDAETMLATAGDLVTARGIAWVRDAITGGQYRHPDGLHYGGARTEESNRILERVVPRQLAGAERVLVIDLHTGHGPRGAVTILSDQPPNSAQHIFFTSVFDRVEATVDNPDATTGKKAGQIANGIRDALNDAECYATSLEFGTAPDIEQLIATYQEQWVHRRGNRTDPSHRAAVWAYRCCFTPDDPDWVQDTFSAGRDNLDRALAAVEAW
jgi:predicted deacylase